MLKCISFAGPLLGCKVYSRGAEGSDRSSFAAVVEEVAMMPNDEVEAGFGGHMGGKERVDRSAVGASPFSKPTSAHRFQYVP